VCGIALSECYSALDSQVCDLCGGLIATIVITAEEDCLVNGRERIEYCLTATDGILILPTYVGRDGRVPIGWRLTDADGRLISSIENGATFTVTELGKYRISPIFE
jgi:hypothetical protein